MRGYLLLNGSRRGCTRCIDWAVGLGRRMCWVLGRGGMVRLFLLILVLRAGVDNTILGSGGLPLLWRIQCLILRLCLLGRVLIYRLPLELGLGPGLGMT